MADKVFKEYYNRLAKEGVLKALICGLIVGFTALFVSAIAFWLAAVEQFWLLIVVFAVAAVAATIISYFVKYRPSKKEIARRVDALGLEERLLTMTQLENDDSYIARRQREDALNALQFVSAKSVKIVVSAAMIVMLSISLVFSAGATTVYALSASGTIPSGSDLIGGGDDEIPEYELLYEETEGGVIEGEFFQIVQEGESATAVEAIPEEGYYFAGWTWIQEGKECESDDPYRLDANVRESMVFTAHFAELPDAEGDGEDQGEPDDGEYKPNGKEGEYGESEEPPLPESGDNVSTSGGFTDEHKQIENGETYYGDSVLEDAESQAKDKMDGNENISGGEKDIVDDYYDAIRD